jgi:hypothetical protein
VCFTKKKPEPTKQIQDARYTAICQKWYIPDLGRCVVNITPGKEFAGFEVGYYYNYLGVQCVSAGISVSVDGRHSYQNDILLEIADARTGKSDILVGAFPLRPEGCEKFEAEDKQTQLLDGLPMDSTFWFVLEDTVDGDDGELRQGVVNIHGWRVVESIEKPECVSKTEWLYPPDDAPKKPATPPKRKPRK